MSVLGNLEPKNVFHYFEEICRIPHGSGNTEQISQYLVDFAKEQGLSYVQDAMGNVTIRKEASPGYEDAPGVIIQGHMDMVCVKIPGSTHDLAKDGLRLEILEDQYLSAKETSLGGDDGIAVAYGLALLAGDYAHPALELLVTVDEEIGLLGAEGLDCSHIQGRQMINIDSEEEGKLLTSCAGGLSAISRIPVHYAEGEGVRCTVRIAGLTGGHSGAEIDKNRGNAIILMGRFLNSLKKKVDFEILSLNGGEKDNAIPRECTVQLLLTPGGEKALAEFGETLEKALQKEYYRTDDGISIDINCEGAAKEEVLIPTDREKVIFYLMHVPNGIQKMSGSIEGLVETSTNLGVCSLTKEEFYASSSVRSSVETARDALADKIAYLTEFLGGDYEANGVYPAWEYKADSPLRDLMARVYEEYYGEKPEMVAIHAGLECGLFYRKMPGLDCISLGPDMRDIHTTEEKLDIASTRRVWEYLLKVLAAMR